MRIKIALSSLSLAILFLSGCGLLPPTFSVRVDSIGSSSADKKTYQLLPGNKDVKADDLQFKEYAAYVHRALFKQGFVPAESFEKASVGIFLSYGIGEPTEHQYSYSTNTYGQTGVSSSRTTGRVSPGGSVSTTTTYTPKYGKIGETSHIGTYTTYSRYMILDAVDLDEYRKSEKEVQLWKTTVTSTGSSSDLRLVFPILVAASSQYIATNTGKKIKVDLYENDAQVKEIKSIANEKIQP